MKSIVRVGANQSRRVAEPGKPEPVKYAEDIVLVTAATKSGQVEGDFDSINISGRITNKDLFGKLTPSKRYELLPEETVESSVTVGSNVTLAPSAQDNSPFGTEQPAEVEPVATETK